MNADEKRSARSALVIAGAIAGAANVEVDIVVAIERVVPDDEVAEIIGLFASRTRTDDRGRFIDRFDVPDETRGHLHGWVMCAVAVQPLVAGTNAYFKAVRWQRPSSDELINGFSALLAALSFDVGVPGANRRRDGHPASRSRFR